MVSAKAESDVPSEAQSAALNVRARRLILVDFIITDLYFYSIVYSMIIQETLNFLFRCEITK